MNTADDKSIALISSIAYLKDELTKENVSTTLQEHTFDLQQQVYDYTHHMNELVRAATTELLALRKAITDGAQTAGFSEEIVNDPEQSIAFMQSTIVALRNSARTLMRRQMFYCAVAALAGGFFALTVPYIMMHFD